MKYILVIGDGMADTGLAQLAGKTPLEALALPSFDRVAGCAAGRVLTVPYGLPAGSDTAILSIFGYAPQTYYTGRSVLEAAGMGMVLPEGSVSLRINLCAVLPGNNGELTIHSHNGGGIHGEDARLLMQALMEDAVFAKYMEESLLHIQVTESFRHIGVLCPKAPLELACLCLTEPHNVLMQPIEAYLPRLVQEGNEATAALGSQIRKMMLRSYEVLKEHPINVKRMAEGKLPANMIWPWGAATAMDLPSFESLFGHSGMVVSAVPLVWGIAALAGLDTPRVQGANGELDTNYEGKADAVVEGLLGGGYDFAAVHVEAPDEMAHAGDLAGKLEAVQNVESRVVARILDQMSQSGEDFRLLLLSDHPTLLTTRMHDGSPVPYGIFDSRIEGAAKRKFCEAEMAGEPVLMDGTELLRILFEQR